MSVERRKKIKSIQWVLFFDKKINVKIVWGLERQKFGIVVWSVQNGNFQGWEKVVLSFYYVILDDFNIL